MTLLCLLVGLAAGCSKQPDAVSAPLTAEEVSTRRTLAAGLMGQFKYADAVDALRPAVSSPHADADLQVDLAIALLNRREADDLQQAASLLDKVLKSTPTNLRAHYCRGLLWFNEGATDDALDAFRHVADSDQSDPYAAYYVGQCLLGKKEFEKAVSWFQRAGKTDPYLRSAPYGEAQALRRLGDFDGATRALELFKRLGSNPRARVAELKYTQMGPKAEVDAGRSVATPAPKPPGKAFAEAAPLADAPPTISPGASITVVDVTGDDELDLFAADSGGETLVLAGSEQGFTALDTHPLSGLRGVNTALWGDYDDDGLVDVYLCRRGENLLFRQTADGGWEDMTETAVVGAGDYNTTDGAVYDIDHDGDLDYLLLQENSPRELLSNNRDGAFRSIATELGLAGDPAGSIGVIVADLDHDDDADLVFLNSNRPHEVFRNDRLWNYEVSDGFGAFIASPALAAIAVDADVDGQTELYAAQEQGITRWAPDAQGEWRPSKLSDVVATQLIAYDFDGDTAIEIAAIGPSHWTLLDAQTGAAEETHARDDGKGTLSLIVNQRGPELVGVGGNGGLVVWRAGPGRLPFVRLTLTGKTDRALEMRSNASGIGVVGVARVGRRWSPLPGDRCSSAPGQSLQPQALGAGGAKTIDFVRLLWPEGVSQTERELKPGAVRKITETQRQAGSCPLLFVWDGDQHAFVADLLGAGGIGFNLGRGEYYPPRPEESFLLPEDLMRPKEGRYVLKLGEPMEEVCYFDAVRLVAHDLPPGWSMTLDERFGGYGPPPTGEPVFYRDEVTPIRATNDRGEDVTAALSHADGDPAPLAHRDHRFIGLTEPHAVTLEFDEPIGALKRPVLVFSGWVEYAYSQSAFAAWQAGEAFSEPTVEAQGADGVWRVVADRFGYPAGTSREGSVSLASDALPVGAHRLRISTNMQVYWDRLRVVDSEPCPETQRVSAELLIANVDEVGFSTRRLHDHRRSEYDYSRRPPLADTRHPLGFYTEFGEATALVTAPDDAVAVIGPGEELHLEFAPPAAPVPEGWTRRWVVEADGWCKDADLFTKDAGTVAPLPRRRPNEANPHRDHLHSKYNTRLRSGY